MRAANGPYGRSPRVSKSSYSVNTEHKTSSGTGVLSKANRILEVDGMVAHGEIFRRSAPWTGCFMVDKDMKYPTCTAGWLSCRGFLTESAQVYSMSYDVLVREG
jgi:hypothetical protein